ncbi:hypothetical protein GCM10020331_059980 [Ectobacillus funiculus]
MYGLSDIYIGTKKYNITNGVRVNLYSVIETVMHRLGREFRYKHISFRKAFMIANVLELLSKNHIVWQRTASYQIYSKCVVKKSQTLDIEKATTELGYLPRVSIEEGIQHFVEWWNAHGHYETKNYMNAGIVHTLKRIAYAKGGWKQVKFPAIAALLHHDKYGYILFDTGYARHFMEATKRLSLFYIRQINACLFFKNNNLLKKSASPGWHISG